MKSWITIASPSTCQTEGFRSSISTFQAKQGFIGMRLQTVQNHLRPSSRSLGPRMLMVELTRLASQTYERLLIPKVRVQ